MPVLDAEAAEPLAVDELEVVRVCVVELILRFEPIEVESVPLRAVADPYKAGFPVSDAVPERMVTDGIVESVALLAVMSMDFEEAPMGIDPVREVPVIIASEEAPVGVENMVEVAEGVLAAPPLYPGR